MWKPCRSNNLSHITEPTEVCGSGELSNKIQLTTKGSLKKHGGMTVELLKFSYGDVLAYTNKTNYTSLQKGSIRNLIAGKRDFFFFFNLCKVWNELGKS